MTSATHDVSAAELPLTSDPYIKRPQIAFTAIMGFLGAGLYFLPGFPFGKGFCLVALISGLLHSFLWICVPHVSHALLRKINYFDMLLLGFAVHYSGGILSPFNLVFICILISGSAYGLKSPVATAAIMGIYLAIVVAEYAGFWKPLPISAMDIYKNRPTLIIVVLTTLGFMAVASALYQFTVESLRVMLEAEQSRKRSVMDQLASSDAVAQVGRMVAKIVHDVRGPLGAVQGFVILLQEGPSLSAQEREDCRMMIHELDRVNDMVSQMLQFVKRSQALVERVDVKEVVEIVLSVIRFYPGAHMIEFYSDLDGAPVLAQKHHLQQIFFNLVKNSVDALKDRPAPRRIDVAVRRDSGTVVTVIEDTGPGIPKAALAKLSREPFSTKKDGGGLGLVIVQELLQSYQGSLKIENRKESGARVTVRLPIIANEKKI